MCLTILACGLKPEVRFFNSSTYNITYGVRFGDASYDGALLEGELTSYYATEPGTYDSIYLKNGDGDWIVVETGSWLIENGSSYTVIYAGTFGNPLELVARD